MIVRKEKFKLAWMELLILVLSVFYVIGIRLWFAVCPTQMDSMASCHWAGEMLKAVSLLILALAVVHMVLPKEGMKMGMDFALIGLSLLTVLIPGTIISICQNTQMACRSAARPWTIMFCVALLLLSLADLIWYLSVLSRDKHHRKEEHS